MEAVNTDAIPRTITMPSLGGQRVVAHLELVGIGPMWSGLVLVHFVDGHTLRITGDNMEVGWQER